ncbi:hypothetical protein ACIQNG_30190 [Streptomyces sp. NPDC091377]|uniref:hypothetical protein n=1 Tax=Streptomyces sp. NPDC091377 TaxID=3365995 RepID=UPI0038266B26
MDSERPEQPERRPVDEVRNPGDTGDNGDNGNTEGAVGAPGAGYRARLSRVALRRSPLVIASVAAAVLLVGGGGAYLATSHSGSSPGSGGADGGNADAPGGAGTPPPLALDGYAGDRSGIAPGEPDPNGGVYRAEGELPGGPESAAVYAATAEVDADEVARLADALGVTGKPVAEGASWRIGGQDGQGPSLQVNRDAPGAWTFHRYSPGPDGCQSPTRCTRPSTGAPGVDPVDEAEALKAAAPVLKAVGQDTAKVDAGEVAGAQRLVNAEPRVGGLPTFGFGTQLTVSAQGELVAGNGLLKTPVKGATYPVLGAARTLELLNSGPDGGGGGIGGCAEPVPLEEGQPESACGPSTDVPDQRGSQASITVTDAVFGLASHTVRGRPTLVPSWLFEVRAPGARDGVTVTHPAVAPEYLTSSVPARPAPSSQPSRAPQPSPSTRDVPVEAYTAEGDELTVRFTGGACADYRVTAKESGGKVTVKVTETSRPDQVCILIAEIKHETVRLDEPLGARKVVGADGEGVVLEKPGARLPR